MLVRARIRKHERGLLFRHGDFERLLAPGGHWLWGRLLGPRRAAVEIADTLNTRFEHKLLDVLVAGDALGDALKVVELSDTERALVWRDGRLFAIVGPGRHAFWRSPYRIDVEVFSVRDVRFEHPKIEAVLAHAGSNALLEAVRVEAQHKLLLYRDGELLDVLGPGLHVFWRNAGKITWKAVDLREQLADVAGQEIMTQDKVTLRVNLLVVYRVVDPVRAASAVSDYAQALYREAQLALRAAIGGRGLDSLLADKDAVGREVRASLARRAEEFGVAVVSVGLRDIILPGEMKLILNQVIEAEKQAQANLIRRREETAAARSQANTARLLAENPLLARIKELELLGEILAGTKATFVFGSGDLANQVRSLIRREESG